VQTHLFTQLAVPAPLQYKVQILLVVWMYRQGSARNSNLNNMPVLRIGLKFKDMLAEQPTSLIGGTFNKYTGWHLAI
jgi:hypothetical protein